MSQHFIALLIFKGNRTIKCTTPAQTDIAQAQSDNTGAVVLHVRLKTVY